MVIKWMENMSDEVVRWKMGMMDVHEGCRMSLVE